MPSTKRHSNRSLNKRKIAKPKYMLKSPKAKKELKKYILAESKNTYEKLKLENRIETDLQENLSSSNVTKNEIPDEIQPKEFPSETEKLAQQSEESVELKSDIELQETNIAAEDVQVTSDEVSEEELDYAQPNEQENVENFFETFRELPDIDEVSLDLTEVVIVEQPIVGETDSTLINEPGKFIDPLVVTQSFYSTKSMKSLPEDLLSFEESKTEVVVKEEKKDEYLSFKEDTSHEEDVEEPPEVVENARVSTTVADDTFELFFETMKEIESQVVAETDSDEAAVKAEQEKQVSENIVTSFLTKLIDHCVAKAEYLDQDIILRRSLDKNKLIHELRAKYDLREMERRKTQFLNKKAVVFFKRKNTLLPISADESKTLALQRQQFNAALASLDKSLIREETSKNLHLSKINILQQQFEEAKQKSNKEIEKLEQLIKSTLERKNFSKLQASVEQNLGKISAAREEISQVRLKLFLQQHQVSSLTEHMEKLENLGNGLSLRQFESLETETSSMSKKTEENNSTLKKLHNQCNDDIHMVAHLRERIEMFRQITTVQKEYLQEMMHDQIHLRQYISELKVQRNRCRNELNYLSYQSGLLTKPTLMRDYDKTVEMATKLRQANENFREIIKDLSAKIALLERNCMQ